MAVGMGMAAKGWLSRLMSWLSGQANVLLSPDFAP